MAIFNSYVKLPEGITILILIQILWSSRLHITWWNANASWDDETTSKEKGPIAAKKKDHECEFYSLVNVYITVENHHAING